DLRYRTATFHRELAQAAGLMSTHATQPLIASLAPARRVEGLHQFVEPFVWRGRDVLLVRAFDSARASVVDPARDFEVVAEVAVGDVADPKLPRAIGGADGWMAGQRADGSTVLVHVDGRPEVAVPVAHVFSAVGW